MLCGGVLCLSLCEFHIAKEEITVCLLECVCLFLFDLILDAPSTIFQLNRDGSSWVEPVLS